MKTRVEKKTTIELTAPDILRRLGLPENGVVWVEWAPYAEGRQTVKLADKVIGPGQPALLFISYTEKDKTP